MNTNANDKKILDLKNIINDKKSKLKPLTFAPVTNCSLDLDGTRYNIHTLNPETLTYLLIKLNSYALSMNNLNIQSFNISGYTIYNWILDIKTKLKIISQKEEEINLKNLESKLSILLLNDKRTELELESIENLLK